MPSLGLSVNQFLQYQSSYAGRGFTTLAIIPGTKQPAFKWRTSEQLARHSNTQSLQWAEHQHGGLNLAVQTGLSQICVLDIDDLYLALPILAKSNIAPKEHWCAVQRGHPNKVHYYFRVPDETFLVRSLASHRLGMDLLCLSSLAMLPPSFHPGGTRYRWQSPRVSKLPPLPKDLISVFTTEDKGKPEATRRPRTALGSTAPSWLNLARQHYQRNDMVALLEAHGYQRRGSKWLSPTSRSGSPGVSLFRSQHDNAGLVYSHHDCPIRSTSGGSNGVSDYVQLYGALVCHGNTERAYEAVKAELAAHYPGVVA